MPADAWGITDAYDDARGERRSTPAATRQALRAAMGGDLADPRPPGDAPVVVVTRESGPATLAPGELFLEDGARLRVAGLLPPDVPLGYHELHPHGGGAPVRVIVCPPVCHLPEGLRTWGWAAQLYAFAQSRAGGSANSRTCAGRLIGSIRRECLNHVLVLGERHLRRILARHFTYYHRVRTHLSLDKDATGGRPIEPPALGRTIPVPEVGGPHHRYVRRAA